MADTKISGYTELTAPASNDMVEILDVSDTSLGASGTNKKVTPTNFITKAHGLSDGIVKIASSVMSPAVAGTDYQVPITAGDVTTSGATSTIGAGKVTLAMQANMATDSVVYRKTAGAGAPEVQTLATLKTDLGLTGTNSGDQTITLTGDVTGSGTGSFAATIAADAVTNAKLSNMATQTIKGRTTAGTGDPEDLTATQATAILNAMVGDSGAGGTKGLVPAPATGDASKFLKGDGTWSTPAGGGSVASDAIWDAKGDLAAGTGADTASRLAVGTNGQVLTADSTQATGLKWSNPAGGGDALTASPLSQFAATTSAQLAGVISDETGTGALVFGTSPVLTTPDLGTPSAAVLTNATGTASGLTSGATNALKSATTTIDVSAATAPSSGQVLRATSSTTATWQTLAGGGDALTTNPLSQFAATTSAQLAGVMSDETGSGALVFATSPTLVTPILGTPTSGTLTNCTGLPLAGVVDSTTEALGVGSLELGHASDTTITRVSAGVAAIEGKNILTTDGGTLTGPITLGENTSIALDPAGSADGKYSGITVTGTGGAVIAFGDLVELSPADSRWELVDVSAASGAIGDARGMIGMAVTSSTDGGALTVLLHGIIRADANFPALTIGGPVYATTAGNITVTQPTTTDHVIRIVGFALTTDEIYFNPSNNYTTHV